MADNKPGTAVIKKGEAFETFRKVLELNKPSISAALPKHLTADRMLRVSLTAARTTPDLLRCDPKGVVEQILTLSQLGLEPNDVRGLAYLIPFKNNRMNRYDCQLIIGYRGFVELARRSGQVATMQTFIVYDKEPFKLVGGSFPHIEHEVYVPEKRGTKKVGVYAVCIFKDGTSQFAFLWADEVEALKKRSAAAKSGSSPWTTDEEAMWQKSAVRKLAKLLPLSPEWAMAAAVDEYQEAGIQTSTASGQVTGTFFPDDELLEDDKDLVGSVAPATPSEPPPPPQQEPPKQNGKKGQAPAYPPPDCPKAAYHDGQLCMYFSSIEETCGDHGPCMFTKVTK